MVGQDIEDKSNARYVEYHTVYPPLKRYINITKEYALAVNLISKIKGTSLIKQETKRQAGG